MAATDFYTLTISEIQRLTPKAVSIAFSIPDELKSLFSFIPGQYLTLKSTINGEEVRRSYSVCSADYESVLRVGVKEVQGGRFSTYANRELKVGDQIEVMAPTGNFHADMSAGKYVAIAGGSGITPILSIIKSSLKASADVSFTLIYGNHDADNIMFKEEIEGLESEYGSRLTVLHKLSAGGGDKYDSGRIDGISLNGWNGQLFDANSVNKFLLCGPGQLMDMTATALSNMGVSKDQMLMELFTAPVSQEPVKQEVEADVEAFTGMSQVTVVVDDESFDFELNTQGNSVLDAGLAAGADLPFACKGGVCCTCRAKVTEGKMRMVQNFSLDDQEIADGYVLTCQSHPDTQKVVVNYDE